MKAKIITGIAFVLISLQSLSAQDSAKVNASVKRSFEKSFTTATNVFWTALPKKISQAQFHYNEGSWVAYFDYAGNILTSGRRIKSPSDLPLKVQEGLRRAKARMEKKGGACQVITIYEMIKDENTKYFVSLQNETHLCSFSISNAGYATMEVTKPRTFQSQINKEAIAKKN